jgi:hypothetical protein
LIGPIPLAGSITSLAFSSTALLLADDFSESLLEGAHPNVNAHKAIIIATNGFIALINLVYSLNLWPN